MRKLKYEWDQNLVMSSWPTFDKMIDFPQLKESWNFCYEVNTIIAATKDYY